MRIDVHKPRSGEKSDVMRNICCQKKGRNFNLKFVKLGNIGGGTGYVKILNHFPNVNFEEDVEEDLVKLPTVHVGP